MVAGAFLQQDDLLAALAEPEEQRQQRDTDIEPRAEVLHLHHGHASQHAQQEAKRQHHHVDDDDVLEPEAVGKVLRQVDEQDDACPER